MPRRKNWLKRLRLTVNQKKVLVEIAVELGVIGIAAVALPAIFDRGSLMVVILGVIFSLASMNDLLIFYLTLSILLLIIVLVSLPTMINGTKKSKR